MEIFKATVVVGTYNRINYLKKCLDSLLRLDFSEYEIIIVNDGSADGTKEFLDSLHNDRIKVFHHEHNRGASIARNTGIEHAQGNIIVFTDDDCVVDKNWLKELLYGFTDESIGLVIGQIFYINKHYHGYFPERLVSNKDAKWPMTANVAYRKKVFEVCGGFDERFFYYNNEDSEMAIRAVSKGFSFKRSPQAVVYHQAADWTPASLLRSARNASVWPVLKKLYPKHYKAFGPSISGGIIVSKEDYVYFLFLPIFIPLVFIRYLFHGKRDLKIFFIKWPVCLILRRLLVYKESIRNRVLML